MGNSLYGECSSIRNLIEDQVFQPPERSGELSPEITNVRFSMIPSRNGNRIEAVIYPNPKKPENNSSGGSKWIIFSHGNASNNDAMLPFYRHLSQELTKMTGSLTYVVGYDYQGYGRSEGEPSEQKCYDDLEMTVEFIRETFSVPEKDICLIGQSLGTGIVIDYVSKSRSVQSVECQETIWKTPVILISPYKSIFRVVSDSSIVSMVRTVDMFNSMEKISKVGCPVRIFHGENDRVIPIFHGRDLSGALSVKTLSPVWIPNCDHNDILGKLPLDKVTEVFTLAQ